MTIVNRTRGNAVVCARVEVADTAWKRLRGLLGRDSLPPAHGMLFRGESSIHSAFMRFRFDAVFMDRDLRVVGLAEDIPPWRARAARGARNILELAAGEISRTGLAIGDQLAESEERDVDPVSGAAGS
ncbi:MAG TPA: DUF192 domain-containing protein [Solirubrobacteraceae bacterium]|nr:DUF192 domain-containing protein [Solirubrobacteraceae bacterium]